MTQWLFWLAIILGLIAWMFTWSWNDFPEVDEWEVCVNDKAVFTIRCSISTVIQVVEALNARFIIGPKYTYKRAE
jgi:hypothetical protein